MTPRFLKAVAILAMIATPPISFAGECGPYGCGSTGCNTCQTGCSTCQSGCSTCEQYSDCSICGCDWGFGDGFGGEGIDVDSLTPEAQSKKLYEMLQGRLIFMMPEDADLYLSGQKMFTPGEKRTFNIPVNDQKKVYKYEIKVDVVRGGKKYYKKMKIDVLRAGAILGINVVAPPVPEGEPALIAMEVVPIAEGGPPPEEDEDGEKKEDAAEEAPAPVAAR